MMRGENRLSRFEHLSHAGGPRFPAPRTLWQVPNAGAQIGLETI